MAYVLKLEDGLLSVDHYLGLKARLDLMDSKASEGLLWATDHAHDESSESTDHLFEDPAFNCTTKCRMIKLVKV